MSSLLHRVAVFSARRRALVLSVWLVLFIGAGFAAHAAGTKYTSTVSVPGSDSAAATATMTRSFSPQLSDSSPIVFHGDDGTLPPVAASLKALAASKYIDRVAPLQTSPDGRTAYTTIVPSVALGDLSEADAQSILDAARAAAPAGVAVDAGSQLGAKLSKPAVETSELVGILFAVAILVLVFGTIT